MNQVKPLIDQLSERCCITRPEAIRLVADTMNRQFATVAGWDSGRPCSSDTVELLKIKLDL